MLCSVSWVQCHMASRAAVGPGAQPSHPTLQMGLSACLPPTPQPHAEDTSPGGTQASHLEASTSQEPKSHSKITKPQTLRTRGPATTGDSTARLGESRGAGVSGWGRDPPPRTVHLAIGLSLKCSPPVAHPLFLVQILGVRRGGPRPPPLSIPSSLFRASSLPSSSACSPWDIFCPLMRWGSHFSKR